MERSITAREANQNFSRLLREVRDGQTYIVTSHGAPVAKIAPVESFDQVSVAAQKVLFGRLRTQKASTKPATWSREELYERGKRG